MSVLRQVLCVSPPFGEEASVLTLTDIEITRNNTCLVRTALVCSAEDQKLLTAFTCLRCLASSVQMHDLDGSRTPSDR